MNFIEALTAAKDHPAKTVRVYRRAGDGDGSPQYTLDDMGLLWKDPDSGDPCLADFLEADDWCVGVEEEA